MAVEKLVNLVLFFVINVSFGCLGLIAVACSSIPVEEARLGKLLAMVRMQVAPPASGPLPVWAYRWAFRLVGLGFVLVSQAGIWSVLSGSDSFYPKSILVPWVGGQWAVLLALCGWLAWGFRRAVSRLGTLPVKRDP